jgi:hypothetical protein
VIRGNVAIPDRDPKSWRKRKQPSWCDNRDPPRRSGVEGEVTDLAQLIIDLWRRLDGLEREIAKGPKQLQHERRYHRPPER